jgi:hypothetical protein
VPELKTNLSVSEYLLCFVFVFLEPERLAWMMFAGLLISQKFYQFLNKHFWGTTIYGDLANLTIYRTGPLSLALSALRVRYMRPNRLLKIHELLFHCHVSPLAVPEIEHSKRLALIKMAKMFIDPIAPPAYLELTSQEERKYGTSAVSKRPNMETGQYKCVA